MKKNRHREQFNLAQKLTLVFSLVSVIPIILISILLYQISTRSLTTSVDEMATIFSSQITQSINTLIEDYDALTRSMLLEDDLIGDLSTEVPVSEQIDNQLKLRKAAIKLATEKPDIQSVTFLDRNGDYYHYNRSGILFDYESFIRQTWVQSIFEDGDPLFITALHDCSYHDYDKDSIVLTIGRRIFGTDGVFEGLILIDLYPTDLVHLSDGFLHERNQYNIKINVVDSEGGLIYDSDIVSGRMQYSQIDTESLLFYEKRPEDYDVREEKTEKLGLKVRTVIPRSTMFFRMNNIRKATLLLVAAMMALIALISVRFSTYIVKQIRQLQAGMKRMEAGKYEQLEDSFGHDEIGSLVESYNHMVVTMQELMNQVYEAGIKQKNAQYLALRRQINPHFLFNTLESIRIKAILSGNDEIADMIKLLARLFRTSLDSDRRDYCVRNELENIHAYVALQNIRFNSSITLKEDVSEDIRNAHIIALIFQPVVENCLKYGSGENRRPIVISIHGERTEDNKICFTIRDDGMGMNPERLSEIREMISRSSEGIDESGESGHIGLSNIAQRIHLRYGQEGSMEIDSAENEGTTVCIIIPCQN